MHIRDSYEYRRIERILDSIHYSRADPRLNHFYHKGFLMAVLAKAARNDSQVLAILEASKEDLVENGWRKTGSEVTKNQPEQ